MQYASGKAGGTAGLRGEPAGQLPGAPNHHRNNSELC
jgi:hypothetical protein